MFFNDFFRFLTIHKQLIYAVLLHCIFPAQVETLRGAGAEGLAPRDFVIGVFSFECGGARRKSGPEKVEKVRPI